MRCPRNICAYNDECRLNIVKIQAHIKRDVCRIVRSCMRNIVNTQATYDKGFSERAGACDEGYRRNVVSM